jgi:hypothetical protein
MAIVVVYTPVGFLIGKESRFLRDLYPEVRHQERFQLPGDYMKHYKHMCKKLSQKYRMRIQFDTPDIYETHVRTRFRYLRNDWKYGIVKGGFDSQKDTSSLDNASREFNEEVMTFDDKNAFQYLNTKIQNRDVYKIHFQNETELYDAILQRKTMCYGELFDIQFLKSEEIKKIWRNVNHVSKQALQLIDPSFS